MLVDRIAPRSRPDTVLARVGVDASGAIRFADAPDALVTIHGRLEWAGKPAAGDQYVKTWVNGFLQESQPLSGSAFQAQVVLNRERNNRVTLEFPNIPASESNLHLLLDTPKPEKQQRLHLVVIGLKSPGDQADAAEQLKTQAEQALTQRLDPEGRDPATFFEQPIRHYPEGKHALTGDFGAEDVYGLLRVVSRNINSASRAHPSGDVLMIYYRGRERLMADRQIELLTGRTTSVPSRFLSAYLSDIRGAHLLFLDVERGGLLAGDSWPNDPHLGLLRVVWNDPQRKAPENTPLISALGAIRRAGSGATGKEVRLEHLEAALVKLFEPVHGRSIEFRPEVPDALRELVLGKSADQ